MTRAFSSQGLLTFLLILALLAALGMLLTERNQRRYFLRSDGPIVIVDRGLPLPYGHGPYHPADSQLAKAYQPFKLPAGVSGPGEDEIFDERSELDQRLGEILLLSAKARLAATDEHHLVDGMSFLDQLDALSQLSSDQRRTARQLRSEVAFAQATDEVARALAALRDAQGLLKLGSEASNAHTKESADLLDRLSPAVDELVRAARGQGVLPSDHVDLPVRPDAGPAIGLH